MKHHSQPPSAENQPKKMILSRSPASRTSLAKFMKTLGVYSSGGGRDQIKLRNQMRRLGIRAFLQG